MSILIKGMEMPSTCEECNLESFCDKWIEARKMCGEWELGVKATIRHPDCPLVPVPPHGDLIDHNALKIAVMDYDAETRIDFLKHAMDCINKAPVVIPSDMPTYEAEEGE